MTEAKPISMKPLTFSPQVEQALAEVCPSTDMLDMPDFDPVDYINKRFPDERALDQLPSFLSEVQQRLGDTEDELIEAVRTQATTASSANADLNKAKDSVIGLFSRVSDIKRKAEESEAMVHALCQDIRQLDTAKQNLSSSIKTLKHLQFLMIAIADLEKSYEQRDYYKCAHHLRTAQDLIVEFESHKNIPKVKELNEKLQDQCKQLEFHILKTIVPDLRIRDGYVASESVKYAMQVVDALGEATRNKVREKFVQAELAGYNALCRQGTEDARLARTERRYASMRRIMELYDKGVGAVFPAQWCVMHELLTEFCIQTHKDLAYQLQEEAGSLEMAVLVRALEKSIEWEKEIHVRMRAASEGLKGIPDYTYQGVIVRCFDQHMTQYVVYEDGAMGDTIQEQVEEENIEALGESDDVEQGQVLLSADDIFMYIEGSLKRVIALNHAQTFAEMAEVWRRHLIGYAQLLSRRMPSQPNTPGEQRCVCLIINTADHCQRTGQELSEEVVAKIDELHRNSVSFDDASDAFSTLTAGGIMALVVGLDKKLTAPMQDFLNTNWSGLSSMNDAMDESPYVGAMRKTMSEQLTTCSHVLNPTYLRFLCDKFAMGFIPRFAAMLLKLKRLNDQGISQLRIDTAALERVFLTMPNVNSPAGAERFTPKQLSSYSKMVKREFGRLVASLKVLQCEPGPRFVDHYFELVAPEDRSVQDFTKLLELKGVKREDLRPWAAMLMKRGVPEITKRDGTRDLGWEADEKELVSTIKTKFEKVSLKSVATAVKFGLNLKKDAAPPNQH